MAPTAMARWDGLYVPDSAWPAASETDVLVRAPAPFLDATAIDTAFRPLVPALRGLAGVTSVIDRARPGELRVLVRFRAGGPRGRAAAELVRKAWALPQEAGFATPTVLPIVRGARALASVEGAAVGGRVEATTWADAHADALIAAGTGTPPQAAVRSHLAGAVRQALAFRVAPANLAQRGIAWTDVLQDLRAWLATDDGSKQLTTAPIVRLGLHTRTLKRRIASNAGVSADVELDALLDINGEQGEPTREAANAGVPPTLWLVDGPPVLPPLPLDQRMKIVGEESHGAFKPTIQSLGTATRMVIQIPPDQPAPTAKDMGDRLSALRARVESVVAVNAVAGLDGVPEPLDEDSRTGRRWTVWLSVATADAGSILENVRTQLEQGHWDVRVLSATNDTGVCWVLDAWGTGGLLVSAEEASQLAPVIGEVARRATTAQEKASALQGPQPAPPPYGYQRVQLAKLRESGLSPDEAALFTSLLEGMRPLGWWHGTPVWLGWPVGDLAPTLGMAALRWPTAGGKAGTGTGGAWLAQDVLQTSDKTVQVDRVRVNGRPALWMIPRAQSELPETVSASFWRLVERAVEVRAKMRLDPMDLALLPIASDVQ